MFNKTMSRMGLFLFLCFFLSSTVWGDSDRIRVCSENPRFWQYEGKPVILLGGTDDDNPFQWPNLREHLDTLAAVGGNYIRNTMSDRKDKGFELYPFKLLENGKYDLDQWNPEYWQRFETMLQLTRERDIIVQIEVWDRFDYARDNWEPHPYNPKNNINYTYEETGFVEQYPDHPGQDKQPFFHCVPGMKKYQKKYDIFHKYQLKAVDKMLSVSLPYGNVLYCMNNETNTDAQWGQYWINHIKQRAKEADVDVCCTDMFDAWDIKSEPHHVLYGNPQIYDFIDVSQNNHNKGQTHWDNIQWVRENIAQKLRPINTVKIYGADTGRYGNTRDGKERFWRNIFGGMAATRFHRPDSGLGLSETAQAHIKSMRMLLGKIDMFHCTPDAKSELLSEREENEAYLTCQKGQQYALFFPDGGAVTLDLTDADGMYAMQWLHIEECSLNRKDEVAGGKKVRIEVPAKGGYWVAILTKE
ncbi:MAG: hypothetical protein C4527_16125 [Candidatus Omnitrophota bacterium]|jgi:hypothetical protein|nr:MAG: hypothetical protein C4527_16125 [Candidatus Omnitrophota bacterium]